MSAIHRRVLSETQAQNDARPVLEIGHPDFIDDVGGIVRLVVLPDRWQAERSEWLAGFLGCDQVFIHNAAECRHLAQAERPFGLMLISGIDIRRIIAIIREVRKTLPAKAVVPVLNSCTAEQSLALMKSGADEVLHMDMSSQEAAARLNAIMRRLQWRALLTEDRDAEDEGAAALYANLHAITTAEMTPQEMRMLAILVENAGQAVPYYSLFRCGRPAGYSSRRTVFVVISRLRRKLVNGLMIENIRGEGFALRDGQQAAGMTEKRPSWPSRSEADSAPRLDVLVEAKESVWA